MTVQASFRFPQPFLWGTVTSARQYEELCPDSFSTRAFPGEISEKGCGWYSGKRWSADLDYAVESHHNAMRISINWARCFPSKDHTSDTALEYYRQLLQGMVDRGIRPIITLEHFAEPQWFAEEGEWANPDAPGLFLNYAETVYSALRFSGADWITFHEPETMVRNAFLRGTFPPGGHNRNKEAFEAFVNITLAHNNVWQMMHKTDENINVGISADFSGHDIQILPKVFTDGKISHGLRRRNLSEVIGHLDFLSVDHYDRAPGSLSRTLAAAEAYNMPMIICVGGEGKTADILAEDLYEVWQEYTSGRQIRGFFCDSLNDCNDWIKGSGIPNGLRSVDPVSGKRTSRPEADFFAEVCRKCELSTADTDRYSPDFRKRLF